MAVSAVSTPATVPTGIRVSTGTLTFDSSYLTGGELITAAQFGAAGVGHNRLPDFVIFGPTLALDDGDTAATLVAGYTPSTGAVQLFGDTATEGTGLDEIDSTVDASHIVVPFLAVWLTPDPAGKTTI